LNYTRINYANVRSLPVTIKRPTAQNHLRFKPKKPLTQMLSCCNIIATPLARSKCMSTSENGWNPTELMRATAIGTACLCLIIIVCFAMLGVYTGHISKEALGNISGLSVGCGVLGLALIPVSVIRMILPGKKNDNSDTERDDKPSASKKSAS